MHARCVLAVLALSASIGGCGGEDEPPPFSTAQVARAFVQRTGDRLVSSPSQAEGQAAALRLEDGATGAGSLEDRYGSFTVYVGDGRPVEPAIYAQDADGEEVRPGADGIFWRQLSPSPPDWQASKRYRNVVLQWDAGEARRLGPGFRRLDAALSPLVGRRVALPPADVPCAQAGIDPERGREGTCKDGAATLTVVDRGRRLVLPGLSVDRVRVSSARRVASPFGEAQRARGRFVVVRGRYENTGDEPLDQVDLTLRVGRRTFSVDGQTQLSVQTRNPLPLQPGASASFGVAFDVPAAGVRDALDVGRLAVVPAPAAGAAGTVDAPQPVGQVRLGG